MGEGVFRGVRMTLALELAVGGRILNFPALISDSCILPPQRDVDHDFVGDACDSDQDK